MTTYAKSNTKRSSAHNKEKQFIQSLLEPAGIQINGPNPWDIQVHDVAFYPRVIQWQSLGLGESYMDGWWDCQQLDECFFRLLRHRIDQQFTNLIRNNYRYWSMSLYHVLKQLRNRLINDARRSQAFKIGEEHYDLGNDLFQCMLDPEMNYSCGYWAKAQNLEQAQQAKLKLICDKLDLQPGHKILDIGCGWGSLARLAARDYGVKVVGLTVSREQKALCDKWNEGLPIEIRLQDYRDLNETFDHIVSIGMFEHVGGHNHRTFMDVAQRSLQENGLFLLHTIGTAVTTQQPDPWIKKYIFPQGLLPSVRQMGEAIENKFIMEDWHNFGADYDKTLLAWYSNFAHHWPTLSQQYSERFYRMWRYYLLACAGAFRARSLQLWQLVLSKNGLLNGYQSIR